MDAMKDLFSGSDFWSNPGTTLWPILVSFGFKLLASIVVYFIGRKVIRAVRKVTDRMMSVQDWDPSVTSFVRSFINIALMAILIYMIVNILGVASTSLVALLASVGVALGMALSGTLQNFAGGVMILFFRPYKVGDYIEAQGQGGTVKEIQIFNTVIITVDNRTIFIPNGGLSTNVIVNYSNQENRRIEWVFGVAYGSKFEEVKQIILNILNADPRILSDPLPDVVLKALNESSVDIQVRVWVNRAQYWDVYYDINAQIYNAFSTKGIDIPFPQLTVHMADKTP
jgi:small conductance mechanosensitive channel